MKRVSPMQAMIYSFVLICISSLVGCGAPQPTTGAEERTRDVSGFEATTAAFHQSLRTNNAASLFMHVSDDVLLMPPGEEAVRGKSAMREWYAGFLSQYQTSGLTLSNQEVFVSDDSAVELGTYEWTLTPAGGGAPLVDRGNYMQVWTLQPDGQWRFAREIWNSTVPVATTAPNGGN